MNSISNARMRPYGKGLPRPIGPNTIECGVEIETEFNPSLLKHELPYLDNINAIIDRVNIEHLDWNVKLIRYGTRTEVAIIEFSRDDTDRQTLLPFLTGQFTAEIEEEEEGSYTLSLFEYAADSSDDDE